MNTLNCVGQPPTTDNIAEKPSGAKFSFHSLLQFFVICPRNLGIKARLNITVRSMCWGKAICVVAARDQSGSMREGALKGLLPLTRPPPPKRLSLTNSPSIPL